MSELVGHLPPGGRWRGGGLVPYACTPLSVDTLPSWLFLHHSYIKIYGLNVCNILECVSEHDVILS